MVLGKGLPSSLFRLAQTFRTSSLIRHKAALLTSALHTTLFLGRSDFVSSGKKGRDKSEKKNVSRPVIRGAWQCVLKIVGLKLNLLRYNEKGMCGGFCSGREERKRVIRADFSCESLGDGVTFFFFFSFFSQISHMRETTTQQDVVKSVKNRFNEAHSCNQ